MEILWRVIAKYLPRNVYLEFRGIIFLEHEENLMLHINLTKHISIFFRKVYFFEEHSAQGKAHYIAGDDTRLC